MAEANKIRHEGNRIKDEGNKLWNTADKLWDEAIKKAYGNIKFKWEYDPDKQDYECHLENGEIFKP